MDICTVSKNLDCSRVSFFASLNSLSLSLSVFRVYRFRRSFQKFRQSLGIENWFQKIEFQTSFFYFSLARLPFYTTLCSVTS